MGEWPIREITDPRVLRAMAHPVRIRLINALVEHGPATATELAERLRDSPANCSWHLRQLAKFGFIEEACDQPRRGRNRPWRWIPVGNRWGGPDTTSELDLAGQELATAVLGFELAQLRAWLAGRLNEEQGWRDAALSVQMVTWLTADELAQVRQQVQELLFNRYSERFTDPAQRPEGARLVRFVAWGVPAQDTPHQAAAEGDR